MIKNDFKLNMLFALTFLVASCSVKSSQRTAKSPGSRDSNQIRKDIGHFAKKHLGTKYKYGGTSPKGFDCSGFTSYIFDHFNIGLSRASHQQARQGKTVNMKWAKKGDLLFFGRGGKITHVALVLENGREGIKVIHSTTSRGVVIDNVSNSSYWKKRMLFARNVLN